jgi:hypothetical protein
MVFPNGKIPDWALAPMPGMPGARLTPEAAGSWGAIRQQVIRDYGWAPTATSIADAYRSYAIQERIFLQRYTLTYNTTQNTVPARTKFWNGRTWYLRKGMATAATPGTSNHGQGVAVDVTGLGGFGTPRYGQFARAATAQGWSNAEGQSIDEYWHWTKISAMLTGNETPGIGGGVDVPDITAPEPIKPKGLFMYLTEAQEHELAKKTNEIYHALIGIAGPPHTVPMPFDQNIAMSVATLRTAVQPVIQESSRLAPIAQAVQTILTRPAGSPGNVDVNEEDIARLVAGLVIPTVVDAIGRNAQTSLTTEQLADITKDAIKDVLGSLND